MRILVTDDNQVSRLLLSKLLKKKGYEVILAADGIEAWEILQRERINLVISDWLMPNMDGLELCKKIRETYFPYYIYIILLTAKNAQDEIIEGMEAGADDFVVKPFNKDELNVRIRAGERIIKLEKDLENKNKRLSEAYSLIKKDLEAAAKIQASLLPRPDSNIPGIRFEWMFLPSTYIAGDILNYFKLDENHVGFYLLDVAGHGIPAALLSVTLSRVLSISDLMDNPLKRFTASPPFYEIIQPAAVVHYLNQRFRADEDSMQYFTMIYGIINTKTGKMKFTQAGHPYPIVGRINGNASIIGTGGFPVGLFPDADYDDNEVYLEKGDRIILYSDGIIECLNNKKGQFSVERLRKLLEKNWNIPLNELTADIKQNLIEWNGKEEFDDDVTLLALEVV